MKTSEKDKWIEQVLGSTDGIQMVNPRNDLDHRILESLDEATRVVRISSSTKWLAAAALALLLTVNILTYRQYSHQEIAESSIEPFMEEYQVVSLNADF